LRASLPRLIVAILAKSENYRVRAHLVRARRNRSFARPHRGEFIAGFFVESVEEETENALNPGLFPSLSLGPGQRFASKGCYVVRFADGAPGGVEAASGWIVP
jgi:hypothetical protein